MARFALFAVPALAALVLLAGCASEPKPGEGMQGAVVGSAQQMMENVSQAKPAEAVQRQNASCSLSVKQPSVLAGEQADVSISASFPGAMVLELYCGDEARSLQGENAISLSTRCRMGEAGFQKISLASGGLECASAIVEVKKKRTGTCYIENASVQRDLSAYNYRWVVYFDGFSDGDAISWLCDSAIGKEKISADPVWGMPRYETLSCSFASEPQSDYMPVLVGGTDCGAVSTR